MLGGMDHRMTTLQRAFQLAKSGRVIGAIKAEGYSANQIEGPVLRRQLVDLIKVARERDSQVHQT